MTTDRQGQHRDTHTRHVHPDGESDAVAAGGDVDRRGFLSCMSWAGVGMLWTLNGGVPRSSLLGAQKPAKGELFFVQISDSHIGFDKAANADVTETLRAAVSKINALPTQPAFLIHTGDISQLSKHIWSTITFSR